MCLGFQPACVSMHHVCVWCSLRPEEGIRTPEAGVTDDDEHPCGWWGPNPFILGKLASAFNC